MHLSPYEFIIRAFGGVRATGRAIGITGSAVSQWGKSGFIPTGSQQDVLKAAKRLKLNVTPYNLVMGGYVNMERRKK